MIIDYRLVLASNSPRRRELLRGIGVDFDVRVIDGIDESYPADMPLTDIAQYIAIRKAASYLPSLSDGELLITADTTVIVDDMLLGKPRDAADARRMLRLLSDKTHSVVTGVALTAVGKQEAFSVSTAVTFKALTDDEIDYYIETFKPFDKAGAYGIQEWIGKVAVEGINGSFYNVVGLPVQRLYRELKKF